MNFKRFGRTANLFDKDNDFYSETASINIQYSQWVTYENSACVKIPCEGNKTYTLSVSTSLPLFRIAEANNINIQPKSTPVDIVVNLNNATEYTFTTLNDTEAIIFQGSYSLRETWKNELMFNEGSTALPYQPYKDWSDIPYYQHKTATDTPTLPAVIYPNDTSITVGIKGNTTQSGTPSPSNPVDVVGVGELETSGEHAGQYKIPISSASTTTPVYLGEVETTRRIKKLVLTGTENWDTYNLGNTNTYFYCSITDNGISNVTPLICSEYTEQNIGNATTDVGIMILSNQLRIRPENADTTTKSAFLTYLQQQYAVGTPVTAWYALATETTGMVNEPLMKIGDYADEVSGITVPTITGADSFDVETTLKPSEVSLSYTGWHDATVQEWDGSQWNK